MYVDPGREVGVVDVHYTARQAWSAFGNEGGSEGWRAAPDEMADTNACGGLALRRKGGSGWSSVEFGVGGGTVALIS